jgi:hypothetical protein
MYIVAELVHDAYGRLGGGKKGLRMTYTEIVV